MRASVGYTPGEDLENLTLAAGAGALAGTGNAANNLILGNDADNLLTGQAGNDRLVGCQGFAGIRSPTSP